MNDDYHEEPYYEDDQQQCKEEKKEQVEMDTEEEFIFLGIFSGLFDWLFK